MRRHAILTKAASDEGRADDSAPVVVTEGAGRTSPAEIVFVDSRLKGWGRSQFGNAIVEAGQIASAEHELCLNLRKNENR